MLLALATGNSAPAVGGGPVTAVVAAVKPDVHVVKAEKALARQQKKKAAEEQKGDGNII